MYPSSNARCVGSALSARLDRRTGFLVRGCAPDQLPTKESRSARVLLGDEELYRFRVVKLGLRIQAQARSLTAKTTLELLVSGVTTWSPVVGRLTAKGLVFRSLV